MRRCAAVSAISRATLIGAGLEPGGCNGLSRRVDALAARNRSSDRDGCAAGLGGLRRRRDEELASDLSRLVGGMALDRSGDHSPDGDGRGRTDYLRRRSTVRYEIDYDPEEAKINDATFVIGSTITSFAALGVIAILIATIGMSNPTNTAFAGWFGIDLMVAAASGALGAVLGFNLGSPRTMTPPAGPQSPVRLPSPANALSSADAEMIRLAIGVCERWPFRTSDRLNPALNADFARVIAKFIASGKADNNPNRLVQLKSALTHAKTDANAAKQLKAESAARCHDPRCHDGCGASKARD